MLARSGALVLLLLALCACHTPSGKTPPKSAGAGQKAPVLAAPLSPWLDPLVQVQSAVRLTTPAGTDLRQALYTKAVPGQGATILIRVRDYSAREEDQPDPQRLQLLDPASASAQDISLVEGLVPVECVTSADASRYCIAALQLGQDVAVDAAPVQLSLYGFGAEPIVLNLPERIYPLGFSDAEHVLCRSVSAVQLDGGLPAFSLNWEAEPTACTAAAPQLGPAVSGAFLSSGEGSQAGYTVNYDPALPGRASIDIESTTKLNGKETSQRWSYPYHVSYAPFAWLPSLTWAGPHTLATYAFLPDATGVSAKANYQGLFRLLALDTLSGKVQLVEDRVQPYLPVVAADGVIFYTLEQLTARGARWELWASSVDGLAKRRLWSSTDAVFASVEDILDGRRLLLQRQYVARVDGAAELHSELIELGLDQLVGGALPVSPGLDQPLKPLAEQQGATAGSDQAGSGDSGEQPPPAPPDSSWSGDGPPPIAAP
jgi:hypothetical protein